MPRAEKDKGALEFLLQLYFIRMGKIRKEQFLFVFIVRRQLIVSIINSSIIVLLVFWVTFITLFIVILFLFDLCAC